MVRVQGISARIGRSGRRNASLLRVAQNCLLPTSPPARRARPRCQLSVREFRATVRCRPAVADRAGGTRRPRRRRAGASQGPRHHRQGRSVDRAGAGDALHPAPSSSRAAPLAAAPCRKLARETSRRRGADQRPAGRAGSRLALARRHAGDDGAADRDGWRLSGRKIYSTGAPILKWYAVWARTDEAEPRVGTFLVPAGLPGTSIVETWDHLGLRASGSHDVVFDDVVIPLDHEIDVRLPEDWQGAAISIQADGARDLRGRDLRRRRTRRARLAGRVPEEPQAVQSRRVAGDAAARAGDRRRHRGEADGQRAADRKLRRRLRRRRRAQASRMPTPSSSPSPTTRSRRSRRRCR